MIVPDLEKQFPQILNLTALRFAVSFLLNNTDESFKIGYNSPGALASVNHLHLHLIQLHQNTFIETIDFVKLNTHQEVFKSSVEDIKFVGFKVNLENFDRSIAKLYGLITWMLESLIPHNLYFLKDSNYVKIFVFAKKEAIVVKALGQVNLAFCELTGYVPVGDQNVYDGLNEDSLLSSYKEASGDIYEKMYNFIEK